MAPRRSIDRSGFSPADRSHHAKVAPAGYGWNDGQTCNPNGCKCQAKTGLRPVEALEASGKRDKAAVAHELAPLNPAVVDAYGWVAYQAGGTKANIAAALAWGVTMGCDGAGDSPTQPSGLEGSGR